MQAYTNAEAQDDLLHIRAVKQTRAARQSRRRHVLQKGGVLYAHNARKAIQRKEDNELEAQLRVKPAQVKVC